MDTWRLGRAIDRGQGTPGELTTAECEELRRLRRLAAEQAETIEVLRKAAGAPGGKVQHGDLVGQGVVRGQLRPPGLLSGQP
ncbi:hypothetical protein, partial [Streptomyces chartreusis]|uniref:hypothetical protein n=1 Tax=Streptomyces chartreusis TaxID=1969 RepID=UPI0038136AF4